MRIRLLNKKRSFAFLCLSAFLLFAQCCLTSSLFAANGKNAIEQSTTISGKLIDANSEPIIGATLVVKGNATKGTVTDFDGNFSMSVDDSNAMIVITSVGFKSKEISASKLQNATITLEESSLLMDEVVVVGYGTKKKRDLTGSIASIGAKDIESSPVNDVLSAMQGKAAGVQITSNSGAPGDGITVRVRGFSSLNSGNEPLYVVDGIPIETKSTSSLNMDESHGLSPLSYINPGDIESIEILKDAASSSIYGSRAANGVVLITTKTGKEGKPKIEVNASMTYSNITRKLSVLNRKEYFNIIKEGYVNEDAYHNRPQSDYNWTIADPYNPAIMGDYDWQSMLYQAAYEKRVGVSVSGGTKLARYSFSTSYLNQDGILLGSNYKRLTARANTEFSVTDKIKIGSNFAYTRSINDRASSGGMGNRSLVVSILVRPPVYALNYPNGDYWGYLLGKRNPIAMAEQTTFENNSNRFNASEYIDIGLFKGLKFRSSINLDLENMREDLFLPSTIDYREGYNEGSVRSSLYYTWSNENYFSYDKTIGEHHFGGVLGNSQQYWRKELTGLDGRFFSSDDLITLNNTGTVISWDSNRSTAHAMVSGFARFSYDYKKNYLAEVTFRADGSSRVGKDNRFGYFPSASFAWRFTEEPWLKALKGFMSDGKLRYSIGQTGNEDIDDYVAQGIFGSSNYLTYPGVIAKVMANPKLKWETTTQNNLGLDISLLNNRIDLTFDAYIKKTTDLLFGVPLPNTTGFEYVTRNIGDIENRGIEFVVTTHNFVKDFKWNTSLNMSFNRNKILRLPEEITKTNGFITNGSFQILQEGQSIGTFYGYNTLGVYARDEDNVNQMRNETTTGRIFKGGDVIWEDLDGNKIIDGKDRKILGNAEPKFIGGLTNDFSYKNFSLNAFLQFVYGSKIYNNVAWFRNDISAYNNVSVEMYEKSWRNQGDVTEYPKIVRNDPMKNLSRVQSRWIEDGSYLKLKSLTFAYNLPPKLLKKVYLANAKLSVSGNNLLTLTKYSGYDPDVNSFSGLQIGIDNGVYPPSRSVQFGINIGF